MSSDPGPRAAQVARDRNRIPRRDLTKQCAGGSLVRVENGLHEGGNLLRSERAHGGSEVEAFVPRDRCHRPETLECRLRSVLRIREVRRYMNAPIPERHVKGLKPFPDAGLAGMNLLASTDQANHDRPGFVPVKVRDQE